MYCALYEEKKLSVEQLEELIKFSYKKNRG